MPWIWIQCNYYFRWLSRNVSGLWLSDLVKESKRRFTGKMRDTVGLLVCQKSLAAPKTCAYGVTVRGTKQPENGQYFGRRSSFIILAPKNQWNSANYGNESRSKHGLWGSPMTHPAHSNSLLPFHVDDDGPFLQEEILGSMPQRSEQDTSSSPL